MNFASDNAGPTHPRILEALAEANRGYLPSYGEDPLTAEVRDRLRDIFEAPEAAIYLVATGTAANALLLSTLAEPWQTVFASPVAHVHEDECGAIPFFSGGATLTLVDAPDAKMSPDALARAIEGAATHGVHGQQRGPVTITQATERGTVYRLDEIRAIGEVARAHGLPLHMDGARFANALAAIGCTPAEMTWKAGVSALSFGGTKNGLMGVEAAILFDPAKAWEFELRRKRAGHLFSKHRFLSAQMAGYLRGDLWLEMARSANGAAARLARGLRQIPGVALAHEPDANMVFAEWPRAAHRRAQGAGARYYLWSGALDGGPDDEKLTARLVCDWSAAEGDTDRFLALVRG